MRILRLLSWAFRNRSIQYYLGVVFTIASIVAVTWGWVVLQFLTLWLSDGLVNPGKIKHQPYGYWEAAAVYLMLPLAGIAFTEGMSDAKASFVNWVLSLLRRKTPKVIRSTGTCRKLGPGGKVHDSHFEIRFGTKKSIPLCGEHLAEYLQQDHRTFVAVTALLVQEHAKSHSGEHKSAPSRIGVTES